MRGSADTRTAEQSMAVSKHRQGDKVVQTLLGEIQRQARRSVPRGKINPQKNWIKMGHD